MPAHILLFFCGDLFLQTFSCLPEMSVIIIVSASAVLLWLLCGKRFQHISLLLAFTLGFCWTAWHANTILSGNLPKEYEGKPLLVIGRVLSLPVSDINGTHFNFAISELRSPYTMGPADKMTFTVKLSWRNNPQHIKAGDTRQFLVRLKRIHGSQSPGAFDFEAWAFQNGLNATGYIMEGNHNILISHDWYHSPVNQIRQAMLEKIRLHLPKTPTSPWLLALILGERDGIPQESWQVLRSTGTNHLMAIAGLHIGMMAGLVHVLVSWLWRRSASLTLRLPASIAGASASLAAAIAYGALAGFSLPAQRACMMLTIYISTLIGRQQINQWHSWSAALFAVLLINPAGVLTESFWLSFGTIALIIYGMSGRLAPTGLWWKWGRVQWVVGVGLVPVNLVLFQQTSLISFVANTIAIPWLGLLILPFCLLGGFIVLIIPALGEILLLIADKSLGLLWTLLTYLSSLQISSWQHAITSHVIVIISIAAFVLLLLPAGLPGKWLGIIWMLPLLLTQPARPQAGDVELALLDVGQGLSVVVNTYSHVLVFDAGPSFAGNMDMGESVVVPYLRHIGARQIDMLVISHGDNDHLGGAGALMKALPVVSIQTSVPEKIPSAAAQYCFAGTEWQWDGVKFSYLYPTRDNLHLINDSSCVLRIDNGKHSVLLTGDIEKYAEHDLLTRMPAKLAAQILIAPHHGSKTSGLPSFIAAVHPQAVLYATGYRNRYHFPHASVVKNYAAIRARQFNTVHTGTIEFILRRDTPEFFPALSREKHKRYWMD